VLDEYFGIAGDSKEFLVSTLAHVALDVSESREEFDGFCRDIAAQLLDKGDARKEAEFAKHIDWLLGRKHCMASFFGSKMTKQVLETAEAMHSAGKDEDAIVFVGLIYLFGNSRPWVEDFKAMSSLRGTDLYVAMYEFIAGQENVYLASPSKYPVSAATPYKGGSDALAGLRHDDVNMKAVAVAVYYISVLVDELQEDRTFVASWRRIADRIQCSDLQAMAFSRVARRALKVDDVLAPPETWTKESIEYVPRAFRKKNPRAYGDVLRKTALASAVGCVLQNRFETINPFEKFPGESHIEHAGCELRKRKNGKSPPWSSTPSWWA